ncbi:MAG: HD domain-containing protein [Gammaproteobacteria bacterium]
MTKSDRSTLTAATVVPFLEGILERRGAESYLGEDVTMLAHMLQSAYGAEEAGEGDEMIVAALVHDIGHYTSEFPEDALEQGVNNYHDAAGAAIVAPFFPALVTDCVRFHVDAKRYLCATESAYFDRLSPASVHSLKLQGGPMKELEVAEFERHPHLHAIVRVRRWDDDAKIPGKVTPPLAHYVPVMQRVVDRESERRRAGI